MVFKRLDFNVILPFGSTKTGNFFPERISTALPPYEHLTFTIASFPSELSAEAPRKGYLTDTTHTLRP